MQPPLLRLHASQLKNQERAHESNPRSITASTTSSSPPPTSPKAQELLREGLQLEFSGLRAGLHQLRQDHCRHRRRFPQRRDPGQTAAGAVRAPDRPLLAGSESNAGAIHRRRADQSSSPPSSSRAASASTSPTARATSWLSGPSRLRSSNKCPGNLSPGATLVDRHCPLHWSNSSPAPAAPSAFSALHAPATGPECSVRTSPRAAQTAAPRFSYSNILNWLTMK